MTYQEILESIRANRKREHEYWGNEQKPARERYVVERFLAICGVVHDQTELIPQPQNSKSDICFRTANFQVKEVPDPGYKWGKAARELRKNAEAATSASDVRWTTGPHNIPNVTTMAECIDDLLSEIDKKYRIEQKQNLDLMIYITCTRAALLTQDWIDCSNPLGFGWRSICVVNEKQAVVIHAASHAPAFLQELGRRLHLAEQTQKPKTATKLA